MEASKGNLFPCLFQILQDTLSSPFVDPINQSCFQSLFPTSYFFFDRSLLLRRTLVGLSPPRKSRNIFPTQNTKLNHTCKVTFACKLTHSQVSGWEHKYLWGTIILSTILSYHYYLMFIPFLFLRLNPTLWSSHFWLLQSQYWIVCIIFFLFYPYTHTHTFYGNQLY